MLKKSLLLLPFAYLFILLLQTDLSLLEDLGRHLKLGEVILDCRCVPNTNLFSYTDTDFPVVNHEWLTQVIFYLSYKNFGLESLLYLKYIIYFLTVGILVYVSKKKSSYFWLAVVSTLAITIISTRFRVRPEMFSYLFISIFLLLIYLFENKKKYFYLLLLIPIQIIWVNMHIFFIFGPLILGTYIIQKFLETKKINKKLLAVFIAVSISNLLNPAFIKGAILPFTFHTNYAISVEENAGLLASLKNLTGTIYTLSLQIYVFELLFLVFLLTLSFYFKKSQISNNINSITTGLLGLKYIRTISLFGIFLIISLPQKLTLIEEKLVKNISKPTINIIKFLSLITVLIIVILHFYGLKKYNILDFGYRPYAESAVNFLNDNNIKGPIFNNYHIGNYLIYGLYPKESVFIDARPEMYSGDFLKKYEGMLNNKNYFDEQATKYNINAVIIGLNYENPAVLQNFIINLIQDSTWVPIYADGNVTIFIKNTDQNRSIIDKYRIAPQS